jgi:predicted O-methyltransferase YrrM
MPAISMASPATENANVDVIKLHRQIRIPEAKRYVSVRPVEAEFMHRWVKEHNLNRTLEIGLAYGASACSIMSAHRGTHTCIDPFQDQHYDNIGLENLASLGDSERLDFHQDFSYLVLPQLVADKRNFDFAFIDGSHLYDSIFTDFFFVDMLLSDRGYVLFHDAWMRGTQLVGSFIRKNRKDYRKMRCPVKNMILFQKIGRDRRSNQHFREFYTLKSFFSHRIITWMMRRGLLQRFFKRGNADKQENPQ